MDDTPPLTTLALPSVPCVLTSSAPLPRAVATLTAIACNSLGNEPEKLLKQGAVPKKPELLPPELRQLMRTAIEVIAKRKRRNTT
jgi:hypothetical protein